MTTIKTDRLYQTDVYARTCQATILAKPAPDEVVLDQSVFFPEGGGQSCDVGTLTDAAGKTYDVIHVREDGDRVIHKLSAPAENLQEGQTVTGTIDWDRRFDNMQRHLGEHILSGAIHRLFAGTNRGFHMGEHYMTIDIRFEDDQQNATGEELTLAMAREAEAEANRIVWQDLPVSVDYFTDAAEAAKMPLRKPLALDEDISVVTVGPVTDPADCCACCGTHPASTGQVGLVKVFKVEKNKDMWRVYFEAGRRAMNHYDAIYDIIDDLSQRYSAPLENPAMILTKLDTEKEKAQANYGALTELRKKQVKRICDAAIKQSEYDLQSWSTAPTTVTPSGMSVADFDSANKIMEDRLIGTCFIRLVEEATVLLYSDGDFDCGAAVKETAPAYQGKGGGSTQSARAIFPNATQMDAFLAHFGCKQDLMI